MRNHFFASSVIPHFRKLFFRPGLIAAGGLVAALCVVFAPTHANADDCDVGAGCNSPDYCGGSVFDYYCTTCRPGTYLSGDSCYYCSAGRYKSGTGTYSCSCCSAGYYQPYTGSTGCYASGAGYYVNSSCRTGRTSASPGYYAPYGANTSQIACPAGRYEPSYASSACNLASAGYYVPTTARTYQTACSVGTYQNLTGRSSCNLASAGYYVPATARSYQTACPVGRYQNLTGQGSCKLAASGYYVPTTARSYQTACPVGFYQPSTGAGSCIPASKGYYVPATARTYQTACPAGTYQDQTGQSSCKACTNCSADTYEGTACSPTTDTDCNTCQQINNCASTETCTTAFNSQCTGCVSNYYLIDGTADQCVYCEASTTCSGNGTCSAVGQCVCNTGFGGANCTDCESGRYGASCLECPTGASTPCSGNGLCDDGLAGTGVCTCNTGYTGTDCDQCDADYFGYPTCAGCSTTCPVDTGVNVGSGASCTSTADRVCDACESGDGNDGSSLSCTTVTAACPTTLETAGCYDAPQAKFQFSEKANGKEKMKMQWKGLGAASYETGFGDPVAGTASVALCIYDDAGALVADMLVDRPGDTCAGKECWKAAGDKAYKYKDKDNASDGVSKLDFPQYVDEKGKAKADAKGKNNFTKSQVALPTGVVGALTGKPSATIQLRTSYGFCSSASVAPSKDDGVQFKAEKK